MSPPTPQKWVDTVKEAVDEVIENNEPVKAFLNIVALETTMNDALLYVRRKRIQLANKYGFKL